TEGARGWAELALRYWGGQIEARPDDPGARVQYAGAAATLGNYPGAVEVLRQGLTRPALADEPTLRRVMAEVHLAWANALASDPKADPSERRRVLEQGLEADPTNGPLLDRLSALARQGGPEAERAQAAIQALLARNDTNAGIHFTLGTLAWES